MRTTASVSGSGLSLLIHTSILMSLAAASVLHTGTLPEPAHRHAPTSPLNLILPDSAAAGGPALPPPPAKGVSRGTRQLNDTQPNAGPPPEPAAVTQPPGETAPPADALAPMDGPPGVPDGDPDGSPYGVDGGIGQHGGGDGTDGSQGIGGPGAGEGPPGRDDTYYLDGKVVPPVLIEKVVPVYPEMARAARLEATLRFEIIVDEQGHVGRITPLRTHPLFEHDAIAAIRKWRYRPATIGGAAVKVHLLVVVEFKLR